MKKNISTKETMDRIGVKSESTLFNTFKKFIWKTNYRVFIEKASFLF